DLPGGGAGGVPGGEEEGLSDLFRSSGRPACCFSCRGDGRLACRLGAAGGPPATKEAAGEPPAATGLRGFRTMIRTALVVTVGFLGLLSPASADAPVKPSPADSEFFE